MLSRENSTTKLSLYIERLLQQARKTYSIRMSHVRDGFHHMVGIHKVRISLVSGMALETSRGSAVFCLACCN
jgi:hypothetical protein